MTKGTSRGEADDAQIHQPPSIVRLKGYAISRVKVVVGSDYADDPLIADESAPNDSGNLVSLLSNSPEVRTARDTRNASANCVRIISPPGESD